jgi:hypothetical protein
MVAFRWHILTEIMTIGCRSFDLFFYFIDSCETTSKVKMAREAAAQLLLLLLLQYCLCV